MQFPESHTPFDFFIHRRSQNIQCIPFGLLTEFPHQYLHIRLSISLHNCLGRRKMPILSLGELAIPFLIVTLSHFLTYKSCPNFQSYFAYDSLGTQTLPFYFFLQNLESPSTWFLLKLPENLRYYKPYLSLHVLYCN